jgi:hypothetical protein
MDNFAAQRNLILQGADFGNLAQLPWMAGNHTRAMRAYVIRIGQLCSIARMARNMD